MEFLKTHKRPVIIAAAAVAVIALALFFLLRSGGGSAGAVYVQSVREITGGGLTLVERFSGVAESQKTEKIAADSTKTVKEVHGQPGDTVKKGDKLFSYDTELISLDVQQAQLEIESLQSSVSTASSQISQYQRERQSVSGSERLAYDAQIQQLQAEINSSNYEIKTKQAALERLKNSLTNADVLAPFDGVVDQVGTVEEPLDGENTMVTLRNGGELRIKGSVSEQNVALLSEGQPVIVRSRVDPTHCWPGTIENIDTGSAQKNENEDFYGGEGGGNRATFYSFYVNLDGGTDGVIMGQHVTIEPDYGQTEVRDGLWLSAGYLVLSDDGSAFVWADNGRGKLEKRSVTLGDYDEDFDEYEILEGLGQDDLIAWPDETCAAGLPTTTELVIDDEEFEGEFGSFDGEYEGDFEEEFEGEVFDEPVEGSVDAEG